MVKLPGVWNLVSFDLMLNGTSIMQPNGPNPLGKLVITAEGYLNALITAPETAIPLPDGTKWKDGSDAQLAAIARPVVAYCGNYNTSYDGEQLVMMTMVDVALDPSVIGKVQRRHVSFVEEDGKEYMIIRPQGTQRSTLPGDINPEDVISTLKWEKEVL